MKKIFTLFTIGAMSLSASFAQRTVDIEVLFDAPAAGSTIKSETAFDVKVTILNNGDDDIKVGDTLYLLMGDQNGYFATQQGVPTAATILTKSDNIPALGSKQYTYSMNLKITGTFQYTICAYVALFNNNQPDSVFDNRLKFGATSNNNRACNQYTLSGPGVGIEEVSVSFLTSNIYPNPASTNATIRFNSQEGAGAGLKIFDISGKEVYTENFTTVEGSNHKSLDISGLKAGVYFYELSLNGSVDRQKFVISR